MIDTKSAIKLALGALEVAGNYALRRQRPYILNHLVTVRCNLACPFCYVSGPEQQEFNRDHYPKKREMNTDEMRAFYRQLVDNRFKLAVILGGEPILRDDLDDILRVAAGHMYVSVFSNGLWLTDRAELIRRATNLFVSIDAPDAQHDELRGRDGLFDKALEGIEHVRRRYPRVRVALNMTVTASNTHRVPEMIAFARELDLPIGFQPPSYEGQFELDDRPTATASSATPNPAEVAEAFRTIREASDRGERIIGSRAFFDLVADDQRTFPCHYPGYVLGPVMPNGDVVGCVESHVIANVRDTPVRDIVSSAPFRANAAGGPTCERGCRDWGIHDLSALYGGQFGVGDLRRYYRTFRPPARRAISC